MLNEKSHRAIDIYDNAMLLIAIKDFLPFVRDDTAKVQKWERVARDIHANVRKHLWDARRQKFIPHIYLDKSCLLDRCKAEKGDLAEAIGEVARAKTAFTPEDVYARGKRTLEQCLLNGTTHMRTQLEVDPGIGLRGLQGVRPLIDEYKWAIDIEICIFPQEGLLNNPGTDALMVEALKTGGSVVGAAPYTDTNPHGQIDRIFDNGSDKNQAAIAP